MAILVVVIAGAAALGACGDGGNAAVAGAPATTFDGGATAPPGAPLTDAAPADADAAPVGPARLTIEGAQVSRNGQPVRLRGGNMEGVTDEEATELADVLHLNFVRLRLSWEDANRDDADPTGVSATYRAEIDTWIQTLARHKIWTLIELRTNDETANEPDLYSVDTPTFAAYARVWRYLAGRYQTQDYIAGYGLLAEPSPDKAKLPDPVVALTTFQHRLMDAISSVGDTRTPFFVGCDFNYDTLEFDDDRYFDAHASYAGRLVYEVNFLTPKPWIDTGTTPAGDPIAYPQAIASPAYDALLAVKPGETYTLPRDAELVFNQRSREPGTFELILTPGFPAWYLARPLAFRQRHHVPLVVDQFGAATTSVGQLAYEQNLIQYLETNDIHWSRWAYNAGSKERRIEGNASVEAAYRALGAAYPHP